MELKFRAWDKDNDSMLNNITQIWWMGHDWLEETDSTNTLRLSWKEGKFGYWRDIIPTQVELLQFTGLTDKNGKEIFEGDIVVFPAMESIAKEGRKLTQSNVVRMHEGYWKPLNIHYIGGFEIEVIGNIYENAELLAVNPSPERAEGSTNS